MPRPWPLLLLREELAPSLVELSPQPKQRERWRPEVPRPRLQLGQRRQPRELAACLPHLYPVAKDLRHLNRRRRLLLLRPQTPALKLLHPQSRRKGALRSRILRGGRTTFRFHTMGADTDHPHNCESTGRNKQCQKQRKLNRLTSAPARSGMSGSGIKSRAETIGVSLPSFQWQRLCFV